MSLGEAIAASMRQAEEQRKTRFSLNDYDPVAAYVTRLLEMQASGEATINETMNDIMILIMTVDKGDVDALREIINTAVDAGLIPLVPNWPSKTGNPSGGNRTNAPQRK